MTFYVFLLCFTRFLELWKEGGKENGEKVKKENWIGEGRQKEGEKGRRGRTGQENRSGLKWVKGKGEGRGGKGKGGEGKEREGFYLG